MALRPELKQYLPSLEAEDLTPTLLRSMNDVAAALSELGFEPNHAKQMAAALESSTAVPDVSDLTLPPPPPPRPSEEAPSGDLLSPPRDWPSSASKATNFVSKTLKGTKMRLVGTLAPENAALLAGVTLRAADSKANAMRVRERTGWVILRGFALYERCEPKDGEQPYVGSVHYWNATPRGLWVDATPRLPQHAAVVLVESVKPPAPPPPSYEAQPGNPLVIVAVEGLCNRLRATLSYRIVAHEQGRPLHVVWRRDDYCPGYFLDVFLPIPGVRFFKSPPGGKPISSLHTATDTHPSIKATEAEARSYACLHPCDSVRAAVAAQLQALGPRFAAMHVRRTDLFTAIPATEHTKDSEFEAWADGYVPRANERRAPKHSEGMRLFVATDNAETQQHFLSLYGSTTAKVQQPIKVSGALRQTGLVEAVVDLFVAAAAPDGFMGSHYSSFSDAIRFLRLTQGRKGAEVSISKASKGKPRAAKEPGDISSTPTAAERRPASMPLQMSSSGAKEGLVSVPPSSADAARRAHDRAMEERALHEQRSTKEPSVPNDDADAADRVRARATAAARERNARATAAAAELATSMAGARPEEPVHDHERGGARDGGMDAPD